MQAEIITTYTATADGLVPIIPTGCGMSDTTETALPLVGQSAVVMVDCASLATLSAHIILWIDDQTYNPNLVPDAAEVDAVSTKIETMTGTPIDPAHKAAIAGMTRKQIADYIRVLLK